MVSWHRLERGLSVMSFRSGSIFPASLGRRILPQLNRIEVAQSIANTFRVDLLDFTIEPANFPLSHDFLLPSSTSWIHSVSNCTAGNLIRILLLTGTSRIAGRAEWRKNVKFDFVPPSAVWKFQIQYQTRSMQLFPFSLVWRLSQRSGGHMTTPWLKCHSAAAVHLTHS